MRRIGEVWVVAVAGWVFWLGWPHSLIGLGIAIGVVAFVFGATSIFMRVVDWAVDRELKGR